MARARRTARGNATKWIGALLAATLAIVTLPPSAPAQFPVPLSQQDPKAILAMLITAFQQCGPPQVYQILGPVVFQAVWQQTGGAGCYFVLQQAGPLRSLVRVGSFELPAGPVVSFRATHDRGVEIWQIGISRFTNRVEWLTYGPANGGNNPPVPTPPSNSDSDEGSGQPQTPTRAQAPSPPSDPEQGCVVYPVMCRGGPG